MILRRDLNLARPLVQYRMIRAAMPELQLERLAAHCQPEDLVPQTDAEYRSFARYFAHLRGLPLQGLGIAGTVREKHPIRRQRKHILRGGTGRNYGNARADLHQPPENV